MDWSLEGVWWYHLLLHMAMRVMSYQGDLSPGLNLTEETRSYIEELVEVTPKLSRKGRRLALPAVSSVLLRHSEQPPKATQLLPDKL